MAVFNKLPVDVLESIAQQLCKNYVTISATGSGKGLPGEKADLDSLYAKILKEGSIEKEMNFCRNILIIGAGASHDCLGAIPLGDRTKAMLYREFRLEDFLCNEVNQPILHKMYDTSVRILGTRSNGRKLGEYALRPDDKDLAGLLRKIWLDDDLFDFESFFQVILAFFDEKNVKDELQKIFGVCYTPVLFYEIVAHLFKHGFIDFVINFNFDEMLDKAIKEEMGPGNYHFIYSDGTCKTMNEISVDDRLKIPVYIKPHGTISHKSSMRFTKEHYYDISDEVSDLLSDVFSGKLASDNNDDSKKGDIEHINIISVGFAFASLELNAIIKKTLARSKEGKLKLSFYPFIISERKKNWQGKEEELKELEEIEEKWREKAELTYLRIEQYMPASFFEEIRQVGEKAEHEHKKNDISFITAKNYEHSNDLSILFWHLFLRIKNKFKRGYEPRGIKHHALIHYIFYPGKDRYGKTHPISDINKTYTDPDFFLLRTIIEFAVILAKNRGRFEIKTAINERLREVYDLYKKHSGRDIVSLRQLAEDIFDMEEGFSYAKNLFNSKGITWAEEKEIELAEKLGWYTGMLSKSESENFGKRILLKLFTAYDRLTNNPEKNDCMPLLAAARLIRIDGDKGYIQWTKEKIASTDAILTRMLSEIYEEVTPQFNDREIYVFNSLKSQQILHTWLSLQNRMQEPLLLDKTDKDKEWTHLFVVEDFAQYLPWLLAIGKQTGQTKYVYLIASMEAVKRKRNNHETISRIAEGHQRYLEKKITAMVKKLLPAGVHNDIRLTVNCLPFYDHNRHMMLFTRIEKPGKPVFLRSISAYKRGFSNKINPIWIKGLIDGPLGKEETADHKMLLKTFGMYHRKSLMYRITGGNMLYVFQRNVVGKKDEDYILRKSDFPDFIDYCEADKEKQEIMQSEVKSKIKELLNKINSL